jgi:hypothetical protein
VIFPPDVHCSLTEQPLTLYIKAFPNSPAPFRSGANHFKFSVSRPNLICEPYAFNQAQKCKLGTLSSHLLRIIARYMLDVEGTGRTITCDGAMITCDHQTGTPRCAPFAVTLRVGYHLAPRFTSLRGRLSCVKHDNRLALLKLLVFQRDGEGNFKLVYARGSSATHVSQFTARVILVARQPMSGSDMRTTKGACAAISSRLAAL